jgi:acetolactate synthase-1/2/3 large subunit
MMMSGARILVECLVEQGVDTVFGYPGGAVLNIYDELGRNEDRVRHILTAHEQGAAHAADGWARSTGKPGVVIATSGPGATNLVTGIATAYMDSSPLVAITGNVPVSLLGKDSFQEVDITGITMPITKHNFIVKEVGLLAETLRQAFAIAMAGRPGPVLVDIAKDVTAAMADWEPDPPEAAERRRRSFAPRRPELPASGELDRAAALLASARRPLIYAGGGVIQAGASEALRALAERLEAPVALSLMGHGAFPSRHRLCTGMVGMHGTRASNMAMTRCDLIVAAGARFSDRVVSNPAGFARSATVLHLDIDPAEINKNVPSSQSLVGELRLVLEALLSRLPAREASAWNAEVEAWKSDRPASHAGRPGELCPRLVIEEAHARAGDAAFVTTEVGQHQMWTAQFWPFTRPRSFVSSGGLGTMGFGTGAAMGVQLAHPEACVVHVAGDGSFRMNCAELATIARHGLPIIILVMNNGTLGMVRQWQAMFYGKRYSQTTLDRPPDFVKLAEAYGVEAWRATDPASLRLALDAAFSRRAPALVDIAIDIDETVLPMVPSGKPIEEQILQA